MAPDVAAAAENRKDQRKLQQQRRRTASQQAPVHNGGITTNADGSARVSVRPSQAQTQYLDAFFAAPLLLQELIAQHNAPIPDRAAASLFLLQHHKELAPHLFEQNRAQAVDWLTNLVLQWSAAPPREIALEMPGTISAQQDIHLSLRSIGALPPKDKIALERLRHKRRYMSDFVLTRLDGKYFVDIYFYSSSAGAQTSTPTQQSVARTTRQRALPLSAYLAMFDSALNARLRAELRLSQQYSRTQFDKLEGWGVNGGLPSLGRRR